MITDLNIQQDIERELAWDPAVTHKHIAVTVKNNAVILLGDVGSYPQKCAAGRAAWRVAHVRAVTNSLRVDLPFASEKSDDDLALAAMSILEWSSIVPSTVEVQCAGGCLVLSGTAAWHYQREEAELVLTGLTGVKGIRNGVQLQPTPYAGDPRPGIEEAMKRSALVDSSHVKTHVSHGVVSLRGTVKTHAEHSEAMRAGWAAPGTTLVEDHIGIG